MSFQVSLWGILEEGNAPAVTKISDDSAPSPVKQPELQKVSMSEELGRGADLISSCKYSPVKVEEKEVMHSTAAKGAGKRSRSNLLLVVGRSRLLLVLLLS
uniref:Uncharacterized protein n=1 Tax=Ditylenchus dipsaci TaxID=166011 RepID=A0A915DVA2_9BILA